MMDAVSPEHAGPDETSRLDDDDAFSISPRLFVESLDRIRERIHRVEKLAERLLIVPAQRGWANRAEAVAGLSYEVRNGFLHGSTSSAVSAPVIASSRASLRTVGGHGVTGAATHFGLRIDQSHSEPGCARSTTTHCHSSVKG